MSFSFEASGKTYKIEDISEDFSEWTVVRQESYKLNKDELIVRKFREEFNFEIKDYKELTNTCSRSRAFTDWLINANLTYSEEAELPLFLKDVVEPKHFNILQSSLTEINKKISEFSIKKRNLAEKYKSDLAEIQKNEDLETKRVKEKDKMLKILSLNSQYLPFSLQLQIERYTPKDEENSQESREVYARECLIKYKRSLCQLVNDEPLVDIDKVIDANMLK